MSEAGSEALTFASACVNTEGVVRVHYARCEPCMWGQHDGGRHDWAGREDIEHAAKTGQPDPSGQICGCYCTNEPSNEPEPPDPDESIDGSPCPECGEVGPCAYDAEGRALIHAMEPDNE